MTFYFRYIDLTCVFLMAFSHYYIYKKTPKKLEISKINLLKFLLSKTKFKYSDRDSSFVWLIVGYFVLLVLDLILKFRLEYIFPLILLFQQVVDECKLSSLSRLFFLFFNYKILKYFFFFSFFFIAVTLCTDYTIHMLTQSLGKELFMVAGFLVWWQVSFF